MGSSSSSSPTEHAFLVYMGVLSLWGVLSNLPILVVYRRKYTTYASLYLLFVLASVDLFVSLVVIPFTALTSVFRLNSRLVCGLSFFCRYFACSVSVNCLLMIAYERYNTISARTMTTFRAVQRSLIRTSRRATFFVLAYCFALSSLCFLFYGTSGGGEESTDGRCHISPAVFYYNLVCCLFLSAITVAMVTLYVKSYLIVRRHIHMRIVMSSRLDVRESAVRAKYANYNLKSITIKLDAATTAAAAAAGTSGGQKETAQTGSGARSVLNEGLIKRLISKYNRSNSRAVELDILDENAAAFELNPLNDESSIGGGGGGHVTPVAEVKVAEEEAPGPVAADELSVLSAGDFFAAPAADQNIRRSAFYDRIFERQIASVCQPEPATISAPTTLIPGGKRRSSMVSMRRASVDSTAAKLKKVKFVTRSFERLSEADEEKRAKFFTFKPESSQVAGGAEADSLFDVNIVDLAAAASGETRLSGSGGGGRKPSRISLPSFGRSSQRRRATTKFFVTASESASSVSEASEPTSPRSDVTTAPGASSDASSEQQHQQSSSCLRRRFSIRRRRKKDRRPTPAPHIVNNRRRFTASVILINNPASLLAAKSRERALNSSDLTLNSNRTTASAASLFSALSGGRRRSGRGRPFGKGTISLDLTNTSMRRDWKVAQMFLLITLIFIASWTPWVLTALRVLAENVFLVNTYFLNNVINPLIYSFLSKSFRRDFLHIFSRPCR